MFRREKHEDTLWVEVVLVVHRHRVEPGVGDEFWARSGRRRFLRRRRLRERRRKNRGGGGGGGASAVAGEALRAGAQGSVHLEVRVVRRDARRRRARPRARRRDVGVEPERGGQLFWLETAARDDDVFVDDVVSLFLRARAPRVSEPVVLEELPRERARALRERALVHALRPDPNERSSFFRVGDNKRAARVQRPPQTFRFFHLPSGADRRIVLLVRRNATIDALLVTDLHLLRHEVLRVVLGVRRQAVHAREPRDGGVRLGLGRDVRRFAARANRNLGGDAFAPLQHLTREPHVRVGDPSLRLDAREHLLVRRAALPHEERNHHGDASGHALRAVHEHVPAGAPRVSYEIEAVVQHARHVFAGRVL